MGGSYSDLNEGCGELMVFLQAQRSRFESDEDFRVFAVDQVRRFVKDLRALGIEVSLRPSWSDQIAVESSPSMMGA